jgi:hypothetical protein
MAAMDDHLRRTSLLCAALIACILGAVTLFARAEHGPGSRVYRWANVEITVPQTDDVGLNVGRLPPISPAHSYTMRVRADLGHDPTIRAELEIDAVDGRVLGDTLSSRYPQIGDQIRASIRVVPASPIRVWPYVEAGRRHDGTEPFIFGSLTYRDPPAASGIRTSPVSNDCVLRDGEAPCQHETLAVYNARSFIHISASTGLISSRERLHPDDVEAFERYVRSIDVDPEPRVEAQ